MSSATMSGAVFGFVKGKLVMLASNAYITGQTISVNGGWYMT